MDALQVEGGTIRGMQRFITDAIWDEDHIGWNYPHLVADEMGDPAGVLMFNKSGFVKKGNDPAGVASRWTSSPNSIAWRLLSTFPQRRRQCRTLTKMS
jgi:hypothetical protein